MKKIIVFGATGSTGSYLIDYLHENLNHEDYEIVATGRRNTDFFCKYGIKYYSVDIQNSEEFKKLPHSDIYAVIILSGMLPAQMKGYIPEKYIDINVVGNFNILEYARRVQADRVLYAQSWADYAGYVGKQLLLKPDMERKLKMTGDHALYSITKTMTVDMMQHYKEAFGIKNFVFRLPNIYMYTPEEYYYLDGKKTLISYRYMIRRAIKGEPIELWGDPNAGKDIIYIKDLCQMFYRALFVDGDGGVYNAGTGVKTTMREQIEGMIEVFCEKDRKSVIIEKPEKVSCTEYVMDIENARRELGYVPQYNYISYLKDYKKEMGLNRFAELY